MWRVTYYYHQRDPLIPSVGAFWRKYPTKLLDQLKNKEVVMAGNGHHDSIRQSTKYGTYTIFCCTIGLLLHILLVRVFQFSTNALGKHHTPITGVFNSPHGK